MIFSEIRKRKRSMTKYSAEQIYKFLFAVDGCFPTPLSKKQNLLYLAEKLRDYATIFAVEEQNEIVAMVAGYTENLTDNMAYISVVATLPKARGKGYARTLVKQFLDMCQNKCIRSAHLYTDKSNTAAIALYKKLGFVPYVADNEPRPEDVHLLYFLNGEKDK